MKGQKFPKSTEKHTKILLFSGFFAVPVSRETDAENQTVPRETYIFHCLKYPSRYCFCARFYSLIIAVLHLKSYVKNRLFPIVFTSNYPYSNTEIPHKIKAIFTTPVTISPPLEALEKPLHRRYRTHPFFHISTTSNTACCPLRISFRIIHIFKSAENYKSALLLLFSGIVAVFF